MIPRMLNGAGAGLLLVVVLATQSTQTACPNDSPTTPQNPQNPQTPQTGEVFTTRDGVRFRVETVLSGLDTPWSLNFAPDGRLFVTERPGRVRIVTTGGSSEVALTLDVYNLGEAGLLGLALDPEFAQNHYVYLYYSASVRSGSVNRIVRYREVNSQLAERVLLLDNIPGAQNHDGGRLRFGPDGLLYASAGDAGDSNTAQDVASLAGKILRLNRDGTVPGSNRFSSPVYTYGHRNPQGFDWHPATGDMWASEHGNSGNDEVNAIRAGLNFGWPRIEGSATMAGMEPPVTSYSPAIAPSGASFYRGQRFPQFANNLFVATLRGTHLLRLTVDTAARRVTAQERLLEGTFGRLRDVISGPDGYLYFCTNNRDGRGNPTSVDDRVLRIVPAS
jgi:glucose/arabinose dehydrogenase